jgi:hypothetical protein
MINCTILLLLVYGTRLRWKQNCFVQADKLVGGNDAFVRVANHTTLSRMTIGVIAARADRWRVIPGSPLSPSPAQCNQHRPLDRRVRWVLDLDPVARAARVVAAVAPLVTMLSGLKHLLLR